MVVHAPTPATPRYLPIVIDIMIDVTHDAGQLNQSGLAVMLVDVVVSAARPVQTCSQKFAATPGEALAILVYVLDWVSVTLEMSGRFPPLPSE